LNFGLASIETRCILHVFWATVCKTVHPMLSDRCLSCLSVYDVGVLWPNGWTDQDETWHAGRPRPGHVVYCGQTAGWMKMPLGAEVYLSPGHIVLDGDPALPPAKGAHQPLFFGPCLICGYGRPSQLLLSSCKYHIPVRVYLYCQVRGGFTTTYVSWSDNGRRRGGTSAFDI